MSEYSYAPRGHRTREPEYVTETTYIERGGRGSGPVRDLVYRPAREDSIEDIPRDFPPPGTEYRQTKYREEYAPRRTRSANRDYDDDSYYAADRRGAPRNDRYDDRHSYAGSYAADRPKPQRRKSIVDKAKEFGEAAGLGGVIGAITGKDRSRSRSRTRRRDDRGYESDRRYDDYDRRSSRYGSRSRSRSRGGRKSDKWEQAAKAALVAGAVEAFRSRNVAGPWTGAKGQRVATAALGAAGIDGLIDRDPDKHEKRHVAESALGGLLASRAVNGSRSRSRARVRDDSPGGRSRSRSRSIFGRSRSRGRSRSASRGAADRDGNPIAKIAGTGAVLAAGKALYDRVRSKSRGPGGRSRSRSRSRNRRDRSRSSSADSYVPSRRNRRSYSRGRSMNNTYQSEAPSRANPDRRLAAAGAGAGAGALAASGGNRSVAQRGGGRDASSDSSSTTDMEEQRKKLRGKELLTAGLATVATIHAAHGVYSSMVASEKRRKLVGEGEMSPEEARKRKSKNMLQDAAAVGIAALGIKSAYSEWKEMNEQRHSVKELESRRRKRRKQRERREREARDNALYGMQNPQTNGANMYAYPVAAQPYPTSYTDANPYGSMPPPPMGARY
ncbi:uncharacterized protein EKO05_0001584 [Ascochyta rabiei]|uniref:Uncharacterized protein n=1 Tax=Didymella rabiei TaxID=5454 RepID=A0A163D100_DIDRA|nr:uncharacterized protein EKO05_0001584 [Ascochyta rabiei]KZM22835.1 hypothetical protein ST47_g6027 [Ascochyta rabiei]UPX10952.1 hypothetical protein EKO05_0001584 [Ascochyta rabiei]